MNNKNRYKKNNSYSIPVFVLSLLFFLAIAFLAYDAVAEDKKINTPVSFQPPPGEEQPDKTAGAGTRDGVSCSQSTAIQGVKTISDRSNLLPLHLTTTAIMERKLFMEGQLKNILLSGLIY